MNSEIQEASRLPAGLRTVLCLIPMGGFSETLVVPLESSSSVTYG